MPVETKADVERATKELTAIIQDSLTAASHTSSPAKRLDPLPARIRTLIREKREKRKLWQETRCPRLRAEVNALVERVKAELDENAAEGWDNHISSITEDIPSVHRLCRQLASTPKPVQPLIGPDGLLKFEAPDRAEILANSLEVQFTPNPTDEAEHVEETERLVRDYLASPPQPTGDKDETPFFVTPGKVMRVVKKLPRRKAPGLDRITNEALKNLPQKTIVALTRLYNGILRAGHFPSGWKTGKVVMLPKPGKDARKPESYRPITLLSTLSKVFERLLLHQLIPHLKPREEQFGFRAEHSTTLQIAKLTNEMATSHNKKEHVVAILLDMEKAFDRVWHEGLLFKLSRSTAPSRIVRVIASFLENRTITVAVENVLSEVRPVRAGVPQGSCLSPTLYAWYTDDIPVVGQAKLALYADDAAYYASSYKPEYAVKRLQPTLDALPKWLQQWRLSVNVAKTQAIITGNTKLPTPLKLMDHQVDWMPAVKYLGVTIDRRLSFLHHVKNVVGQVRGARAKLLPILGSRLPLRTKILISKTYLRSRLTYAAPAWYPFLSKVNKDRLQAQENITLRKIVGAPRYVKNTTIAKDLEYENLDTFVRRLTTKMFGRADASSHEHLRGIAPLHARPPDEPGKRRMKPYSRDLTTTQTGAPAQVATALTADRSAGPPLSNQGSHPAGPDRVGQ